MLRDGLRVINGPFLTAESEWFAAPLEFPQTERSDQTAQPDREFRIFRLSG